MNRLMRMISAAMLVMLLTAVFAIAGDEADTTQPGLELTRLPLSSPLIPLSSGVLTNVDASATNWRQVSARLFSIDSTIVGPRVYFSRNSMGAYDALDEQFLRTWEATPQILIDREIKRFHLSPDGRVIKP